MQERWYHIWIGLLLLASVQPVFVRANEKDVREEVLLTTDRSMYFAGSQVLFKADIRRQGSDHPEASSTVLYLEVFDPANRVVVQQKSPVNGGTSIGSILLPEDLVTGTYFIRAYTQVMRNRGPEHFWTNQLLVIHPGKKPEVPLMKAVTDGPVPPGCPMAPPMPCGLQTDRVVYHPGEVVHVRMTSSAGAHLSVRVVPSGAFRESHNGLQYRMKPPAARLDQQTAWYPEIRGISISGRVVYAGTQTPCSGVRVYVGVKDGEEQFHVTHTDSSGYFVVGLQHLAQHQKVFITTEKQSDQRFQILVNNNFSPDFATLPMQPMKIDSDDLGMINMLYIARQAQVSDTLLHVKRLDTVAWLPNPFQGAGQRILLKDYVEIPSMAEVFNEIVPYVSVHENKGKRMIETFDARSNTPFRHPLVLLDCIPFEDHEALLALLPSQVESVEVISDYFLIGGVSVEGLINISTYQHNLGGLALPLEGVSVEMDGFAQLTEQHVVQTSLQDVRALIYWNPEVELNNGQASLQFPVNDVEGSYDVIVTGLTESGERIFDTQTFQLKP
ncbi:MAG: hypothetical protein H6585_14985 [Flavobacteriales bacterium]|nr:hypothetical protein [Flavobacteriales bacterium]